MDPHNAGRTDSICDDIVARHSDYLDGLLAPHEAARMQWHLSTCTSCARYDRVLRRGLDLVRDMPEISPSDDFAERLQHRLYHVQDGAAIASQRSSGAAATFAVASVIALLAWSPMLFNEGDDAPAMVSTAVERPAPEPTPLPMAPLFSTDDLWSPVSHAPLRSSDLIATMAAFPGPYSPLVVMPPVHGGAVRTVSSEYMTVD